ncbi:hypothetical protein PSUB009319_41920 [Ralstonia sp. SET104]|nr:hypothetical protein PSUB009319_41920 [Ralstonia sp. SET104]
MHSLGLKSAISQETLDSLRPAFGKGQSTALAGVGVAVNHEHAVVRKPGFQVGKPIAQTQRAPGIKCRRIVWEGQVQPLHWAARQRCC